MNLHVQEKSGDCGGEQAYSDNPVSIQGTEAERKTSILRAAIGSAEAVARELSRQGDDDLY